MMEETGCAGVVVGRGCLGRPWLFKDLVNAFNGSNEKVTPTLFEVRDVMKRHAILLTEFFEQEGRAMRDLRKHMAWYLKGFAVGSTVRAALGQVHSLADVEALLAQVDPDQPTDPAAAASPRGRTTPQRPVALPEGWLASRELPQGFAMAEAESDVSGG